MKKSNQSPRPVRVPPVIPARSQRPHPRQVTTHWIESTAEAGAKSRPNRLPDSPRQEQAYLVVVIDHATMDGTRANPPGSDVHIVTASSPEDAEDKAVAINNAENDLGPDEDGGFIPVRVLSREDLQRFIEEMAQ
jgi:hypothetical protein